MTSECRLRGLLDKNPFPDCCLWEWGLGKHCNDGPAVVKDCYGLIYCLASQTATEDGWQWKTKQIMTGQLISTMSKQIKMHLNTQGLHTLNELDSYLCQHDVIYLQQVSVFNWRHSPTVGMLSILSPFILKIIPDYPPVSQQIYFYLMLCWRWPPPFYKSYIVGLWREI